jgi:hypothetical protein
MYSLVISNSDLAKEMGLLEPIITQYSKMNSDAQVPVYKTDMNGNLVEVGKMEKGGKLLSAGKNDNSLEIKEKELRIEKLQKEIGGKEADPLDVEKKQLEIEKLKKEVAGGKGKTLSPILQKAKDTRAEKVITSIEENNYVRDYLNQATELSKKVSGGLFGKLSRNMMKNFDPNNPALKDWQIIKTILTDEQLEKTMKTKGAISDPEMAEFAKAVANDDLMGFARLAPVLERALKRINADETAQTKTFKKLYGEDPYEWEGVQSNIQNQGVQTNMPASQSILTATNPKTKAKIQSTDGGKTWQPA